MHFKTGVKKDGSHHGACTCRTLLDGGAYGSYGVARTYYTGALQTVTYKVPTLPLRRRALLHEQAALRPQARPRHAAAALRPRGPARQDRASASASTRRTCACRMLQPAEQRSRPTSCASARWASGSASRKVVEGSGWREKHGKLAAAAAASASRARPTSRGAGLPIYWNAMPHSGVQLKIDRGGGVTVFCGATDIGQGSRHGARGVRGRGARHRARSTSASCVADTDLTPVDLGSYSQPRDADDGQRGDPGGRARARDLIAKAVAEKLGVPVEPARVRGEPRLRRRGPDEREDVDDLRRGRRSSARRSAARSAPWAPTPRRPRRAATAARASARRRPTRTAPPSSRWRRARTPASST